MWKSAEEGDRAVFVSFFFFSDPNNRSEVTFFTWIKLLGLPAWGMGINRTFRHIQVKIVEA